MRITNPLLVPIIIVALAAQTTYSQPAPGDSIWQYRGFRCDTSVLDKTELAKEVHAAVREQIDIVYAVGVAADVMDFFRKVPLVVVDSLRGSPGRYTEAKSVELAVSIVAYHHRPVFLHELLHAFHEQKLKDGVRNEEIRTYYQRAKQKDAYSPKSHMMENVQEFFACSATTYLAGYTGQEPFFRDKLRSNQPQFFDHLRRLFGVDSGKHEGSREGPDLKRLAQLKEPNKASEPTPGSITPHAAH